MFAVHLQSQSAQPFSKKGKREGEQHGRLLPVHCCILMAFSQADSDSIFCSMTHKSRGYLADLIDSSWYEDVLPNDGRRPAPFHTTAASRS